MKKKILAILITVFALCTCMFTLTACGENEPPHTHDYTTLNYNETQHWYECSCGDKTTAENHKGGLTTTTSKAKCSICNSEYGEYEKPATEGVVFALNAEETEYSVTDYTGNSTEIYIPSSYKNKPVTSIGDEALRFCSSLTDITIPNSVTSIGALAFAFCDSLTSITIPNSVTRIGYGAFSCCSSLTSIVIPNSITSISDYAFYNCTSITSVVLGNGITSIGAMAFSGCSSLASVVIPDSVTIIGRDAFEYCSSLTSVTIGDGVTSIGDSAFEYCSSLTSVTIGNSVTVICNFAFYHCSKITTIRYRGSETQWLKISQLLAWNQDSSSYTIIFNYTGE